MMQRHQRIVFWCLIVCIVAMGAFLFWERQSGRDRIQALGDAMPLDAPTAASEPVTLTLANDADGTLTSTTRSLALPTELNARARALIDHLVAEYALPGSPHPLPPGAAVDEVFLIPLPVVGYTVDSSAPHTSSLGDNAPVATTPVAPSDAEAQQPQSPGGELAVIDLRGAFVDQHPSGVEVESLTLLSIIGTLHANLPQIEQVRFLVDGKQRETLAGHADLLRTYPSRDTTASTIVSQPTPQ
jgi:hypothetical protein